MQQVRTTLRLPKNLHEDLKQEAERKGKSLNELVVNKLKKQKDAYRAKIVRDLEKISKQVKSKGITDKEILEFVRDGRKYEK